MLVPNPLTVVPNENVSSKENIYVLADICYLFSLREKYFFKEVVAKRKLAS